MEFQENQRGRLFTFRDAISLLRPILCQIKRVYRRVARRNRR